MILSGDCIEVMRRIEPSSVDAIVTDPPAGIGFMGKAWDGDKGGRDQWIAWLAEVMRECVRVLKPGGHALVWALPRTSHWTATAVEDAGFQIRDCIVHLFGSGFPKSLDVSKAIDRAAGAEREIVGQGPFAARRPRADHATQGLTMADDAYVRPAGQPITDPATDAARAWAGWGTALKPAAEHWILARKPLEGTVAQNVLAHGTGAINVDACRIGTTDNLNGGAYTGDGARNTLFGLGNSGREYTQPAGRWPANVVLSDDAAEALGEHARFFYCAKASRRDRGEGNTHPTVKPLALMRYLVRLITPPGGTVLDPFAGSGTTIVAAGLEGFNAIGIERDPAYVAIAESRAS